MLDQTDQWAENAIYNNVRNGIAAEVAQKYPHLPDAQRNELVNKQFAEIKATQKQALDQQIKGTGNLFRSKFQDDDGQTYLLAIDPWLWYGLAKQYINNGIWGDRIQDDRNINSLRRGRIGLREAFPVVSYVEAKVYQFLHFFGSEISLLTIAFFYPVVVLSLAIIPTFFIARKLGGNIGGIIAATLVAVHPGLMGRTVGGFADTDAFIAFFALFISWAFLAALDGKETKERVRYGLLANFFGLFSERVRYALLAGFLIGLFSITWGGYWFIVDFLIATLGIYTLSYLYDNRDTLKKKLSTIMTKALLSPVFLVPVSYVVFGGFFTWFTSTNNKPFFTAVWEMIYIPFSRTLGYIRLKEVAVTTLWPNVLTTVAELNPSTLERVIDGLGGKFMFSIAVLGIILCFVYKDKEGNRYFHYGTLLTIWFFATLYASKNSLRFIALVVPGYAIALGIGVGLLCKYFSNWSSQELGINKTLVKTVFSILFLLILLAPFNAGKAAAMGAVPSMNDDWYDSLTAIKDDTDQGHTTSWWDFGHWFVAISERSVTFDGGDQGRRIHWVGKSLLVSDERESIGILKMLNCGQNEAYHSLNAYTNNDTVESIRILNTIIMQEKDEARTTLIGEGFSDSQTSVVLNLTHCTPWDHYYITSEDMVSKAGVWGHFGSWNFTKAEMWQTARRMKQTEAITFLEETYGLSKDLATQYYYEIQSTSADQWISPWPGYFTSKSACRIEGTSAKCNNGLVVDLLTLDAKLVLPEGSITPYSLTYVEGEEVVQKIYKDENKHPYAAALIPSGNGFVSTLMDPMHANSTFMKLFYYSGHGSKYFDILSDKTTINGQRVIVYKVDWEGASKNMVFVSQKEAIASEQANETSMEEQTRSNDTEEEKEGSDEEKNESLDNNTGI